MPGDVAVNVYGAGHTRNVGRHGFNIQADSGGFAAEALGSNAKSVDFLQHFLFQLSVIGIGVMGVQWTHQRLFGKERRFALLQWARRGVDHLFLAACDEGGKVRSLGTTDIGAMIKATAPTISILENGMVIIIHRNGVDTFVRSEFWSLPSVLKLKSRMLVADPATAAQNRVRELYKESGGVKPTARPWWKLW